ncbi:DUF2795 domain-containing protein [Haloarchaeobius sp. FL176]|uniref:DUF5789 family protein n=1 Tax=Haloarchaeobius sp. FL176 TaxID=2967129 RepID=UPI002147390F|nr:DUF2795 domain-containing protein [Haloarchaeobius sp. FL176]
MFRNGTDERIENQTYPLTADELAAELGDAQLDLTHGSHTVAEVLEGIRCEETFQRPEDVRFTLVGGVSEDAVGRKGYSDRDPTPPGSPEAPDTVSF